jgi:hypothetical protein
MGRARGARKLEPIRLQLRKLVASARHGVLRLVGPTTAVVRSRLATHDEVTSCRERPSRGPRRSALLAPDAARLLPCARCKRRLLPHVTHGNVSQMYSAPNTRCSL